MKKTRRNHAPGFKAKAALAAIKGDKAMVKLSNIRCSSESDFGFEAAVVGISRRYIWRDEG